MEEKKKKTLDMRVRLAAEGMGMVGKFNLAQYREKKSKHMGVCKELVRISDKYGNYPITTLLQPLTQRSVTWLSPPRRVESSTSRTYISVLPIELR